MIFYYQYKFYKTNSKVLQKNYNFVIKVKYLRIVLKNYKIYDLITCRDSKFKYILQTTC